MNDKSPAYKAGLFVALPHCHTAQGVLPNRKFSGTGQNFAEDRDRIILKRTGRRSLILLKNKHSEEPLWKK
jgi:hypothetical protein